MEQVLNNGDTKKEGEMGCRGDQLCGHESRERGCDGKGASASASTVRDMRPLDSRPHAETAEKEEEEEGEG